MGHPNPIELQRHKVYEFVNQQSGQQCGEQAKLEHRDQSKPGQNLGGQLEFEATHQIGTSTAGTSPIPPQANSSTALHSLTLPSLMTGIVIS